MIDATYLDELVDHATSHLVGDEVLLAATHSESTDFVRFNESRVRQAGNVEQSSIDLDLVEGRRHTQAGLRLSGDAAGDRARVVAVVERLRAQRALVPDDPHLIINTDARSTQYVGDDELPPSDEALAAIAQGAAGKDLVGIYAAGAVASGFANSLGQRNWFQTSTFNFDWTFSVQADKAVKSSYAGYRWDEQTFGRKLGDATTKLEALGRSAMTLSPGEYRTYLTPSALHEIVELLAWGSFGVRAQRTSQSALLRLRTGEGALHPSVRISEDTANGVAPDFQEQGFLRPSEVVLIEHGRPVDALVSPRSAVEFDIEPNGAAEDEAPRSLAIAAGDLDVDEVLGELGTGLYIGNLWYTNFSDRPACRVTGMTRVATFWVEGGEIVAPVNVARFDDSLYRLLGSQLAGLTSEPEFVFDNSTYVQRISASIKLPGALVDAMRFTG